MPSRSSLWALGAVAAQLLWIVVYRSVAAPVNVELTRHARAGFVPADARALQARWDSVIVARVLLNTALALSMHGGATVLVAVLGVVLFRSRPGSTGGTIRVGTDAAV